MKKTGLRNNPNVKEVVLLYLFRVQRGSIRKIKKCLGEGLLIQSTLQIDFVDAQGMEIICETSYAPYTVAYMIEVLRCKPIPDANPLLSFGVDKPEDATSESI